MFRAGGIRTWILSGDKVQTIQCIALSARLIDPKNTPFNVIENQTEFDSAMQMLMRVQPHECLVIDGVSLQTLLGSRPSTYYLTHKLKSAFPEQLVPLNKFQVFMQSAKRFFLNYVTGQTQKQLGKQDPRNIFAQITAKLPAVCCCRCSPDQKALICKLLSQYTQQETAGIGDGANDVSLL